MTGTVEWRPVDAWGITPLGLPWFGENGGAWSRQPVFPQPVLPESLRTLAACPSGARVRFRTNADIVHLRITYQAGSPEPPRNIALTGSRGAEIWVDGAFSPVASGPAVGALKRGLNQTAGLDAVRAAVRSTVQRRVGAGESALTFVDGLDLLGPAELDGLTDDLHPNDHGHARIAQRLAPIVLQKLQQS